MSLGGDCFWKDSHLWKFIKYLTGFFWSTIFGFLLYNICELPHLWKIDIILKIIQLCVLRNSKWRQILKDYMKIVISKSNLMLDTVICGLEVVSLLSGLVIWLHQLPLMSSATINALQMQKTQCQNTQLLDVILHILVLEGCILCERVGFLVCLSLQAIISNF